ncbi:MAG: flagellar hook-length control protein FliK [Desulfosarcina sp.]|nr:flagellar hook-length control protein FliK [Desulfobacterales bacterium]
MNAVPTMPIQAELPVTGLKTDVQRGSEPGTPAGDDPQSFMSTLRKVKEEVQTRKPGGKPVDAEGDGFSTGEATLNLVEGETEDSQTVPVAPENLLYSEAPPTTPAGEGIAAETAAPVGNPAPLLEEGVAPTNAEAETVMPVGNPAPLLAEGVAPTEAEAETASPAGNSTPLLEESVASTDARAEMETGRTPARPAALIPPDDGKKITFPGSSDRDASDKNDHLTPARMVMTEKIVPSEDRHPEQADLPDGFEDLLRPQTAAKNATTANATRSADGNSSQGTADTRPETHILAGVLAREQDKTVPTPPNSVGNAKVIAEAATGMQTQPTDGEIAEETNLRPAPSETTADPNRIVRPARLDVESRPDGVAPVDRNAPAALNRASQSLFVEKETPLPAESFRENNITRIVERMTVSIRGDQSEARIALKPDHLGSIRLQIATENNTVSIKIITEFSMARDLLESHLPQLKTELQQQGLKIEEFNVSLAEDQDNLQRDGRRHEEARPGRFFPGAREKSTDRPDPEKLGDSLSDRRRKSVGIDFFA